MKVFLTVINSFLWQNELKEKFLFPDELTEEMKDYDWVTWEGFIRKSVETQISLLKKGDTRIIFEFVYKEAKN